ncbi:MAG: exodeoxyribonuclease III [Solobacterium sp.]|nr:exodeoxyribonuclease III [Solobacterium sp.]
MKFVSWNVNGLRAIQKKGFAEIFKELNADVFAIQETKMDESLYDELPNFEGYEKVMNGAEKKGYSGTLVYYRIPAEKIVKDIKGDSSNEGRVITIDFGDFYFVNAYVPNSKEELARLDFRMEWEDALRNHLKKLDKKKPVIYTGDLNVAHEEIDLKNPDSNHHNAGFSDEERAKFSQLLDAGFSDTFRSLYPDTVKYSWWSYRFHAREKNIGWRIDYFVVSSRILKKVKDSFIYEDIMGSDHCPIGIEIDL